MVGANLLSIGKVLAAPVRQDGKVDRYAGLNAMDAKFNAKDAMVLFMLAVSTA
jgi:hypothetical protein